MARYRPDTTCTVGDCRKRTQSITRLCSDHRPRLTQRKRSTCKDCGKETWANDSICQGCREETAVRPVKTCKDCGGDHRSVYYDTCRACRSADPWPEELQDGRWVTAAGGIKKWKAA